VGGTAVAEAVIVAIGVFVGACVGAAVGSWAKAACLVTGGMGVATAVTWQAINQRESIDNKQKVLCMGPIVADAVDLSSIVSASFGILSLLPNIFLYIINFTVINNRNMVI
jgi:hypothetical protein